MAHEFDVTNDLISPARPARRVNWVALTGLIAVGAVGLALATTAWQVYDPAPPATVVSTAPASGSGPQAMASSVIFDAGALVATPPATF